MRGRASLVALAVAACAACAPPPTGTVVLTIEPVVGEAPLRLGEALTTRYGQTLTFADWAFWLTNLEIIGPDGPLPPEEPFWLVGDGREGAGLEVRARVPPGAFDRFAFLVGVDRAHNADLSLLPGALRTGIGMDRGADAGWTFLRTGGSFVDPQGAGEFLVATGNDVLLRRVEAPLGATRTVEEDGEVALRIQADFERMFAGIQLAQTPRIEGGLLESVAGTVASNYGRMFSFVGADGLVRMDATSPNLQTAGPPPSDATPPVLTVFPVAAADLHCDEVEERPAAERRGCAQGFLLQPGGWEDAGQHSAVVRDGATVRAAAGGVVTDVVFLEHSEITHSDLYVVSVRRSDDGAFAVDYRPLKELRVSEGDAVEAGDVLGLAGDHFEEGVAVAGWTVRRRQELVQRLCPSLYADDAYRADLDALLAASAAAFPDLPPGIGCAEVALVCAGASCEAPDDFAPVGGDVDGGRRLYADGCASCHGDAGEGGIADPLCGDGSCGCATCDEQEGLAARIAFDMPPEGECTGDCARDTAAFVLYALPP